MPLFAALCALLPCASVFSLERVQHQYALLAPPRARRIIVAVAVATTLSSSSAARQTNGPPAGEPEAFPLRIADPLLRSAVLEGAARSPTLRGLLDRLGESRAAVYVQWSPVLPPHVEAVTRHRVTATGDVRYLWIAVKPAVVNDYVVALVAHELRHVIEILDAGVTRPAEIAALFKRLSGGINLAVYETSAAQDTGDAVYRELRAR